jgi:hypothetical protein
MAAAVYKYSTRILEPPSAVKNYELEDFETPGADGGIHPQACGADRAALTQVEQ